MKKSILLLLAVAAAATGLRAQTLTWTQRTTGVAAGLQYTAAAYGAGKYAVTAYGSGTTSGTFQSQVATSADGITWSAVALPTGPVARGITYGGGLWVVPAERNGSDSANTQNILTSPDGVTWTPRTTGAGTLWKVAHTTAGSANLYVAGGLTTNSPAGSNIAYSSDAITWSRTNIGGADARVNYVTAGNGVFIAATQTGGQVYRSTNGQTWSTVTLPGTISINFIVGLVYAGGEFIAAVQVDGGAARIYTSPDGSAWTARGNASPATPASITITGLGASGAASAGARVIAAGNSTNFTTFEGASYIFHSTGAHTTWTTQQLGSGDFANNNFAFFANDLWLVGNNKTQLFTAADTAGGTGGGSTTPAPTISTQPLAAQSVTAGGSVTFSVTAGGTGLTYQWRFNGTAITGATSASYTLAAVTAANAGSYTVTVTNAGGSLTSTASVLTVNAAAPGIAYLSNASVLARAGTGTESLTVGVTIGGGSGTKSVLIRGVGPALSAFGVPGVLADPTLTIFQGQTQVAGNDDWSSESTNAAAVTAANTAVGAFPLAAGSKDAALYGTGINAAGYTIQLAGKACTVGTGLIELYDPAAAATITANTPRITNVSALTFGGTGSNTLILGFTVGGTGTRRLLIRASGPGLIPLGVASTMPDPKLELFNGAGAKVDENDTWAANTLATQTAAGAFAFPANSKDAVLVVTLAPGGYTAQVTAVGGATGVALVEIYELP